MTSAFTAHLSAALLLVFAAVATIDGVWLHLWKLRLHARSTSFVEHIWHTATAVLFVPTIALLFVVPSSGWMLWLAIVLLLGTHVAEVFDVRAERQSRRALGGLTRFELSMHVTALVSRTLAIALLLFSRPLEIWTLDGTSAMLPSVVVYVGLAVALGGSGVALLHLVLAALYCPLCGCRRFAGAR